MTPLLVSRRNNLANLPASPVRSITLPVYGDYYHPDVTLHGDPVMSVDELPYTLVISLRQMQSILSRVKEPKFSVLVDRLEKNPIGKSAPSAIPGVLTRIVGYKWYSSGFGDKGRDPTMWPVVRWERETGEVIRE